LKTKAKQTQATAFNLPTFKAFKTLSKHFTQKNSLSSACFQLFFRRFLHYNSIHSHNECLIASELAAIQKGGELRTMNFHASDFSLVPRYIFKSHESGSFARF
jgi:hypothetical protein